MRGYITPDVLSGDYIIRRLIIPNDTLFLGAVNGALLALADPRNWESVTGISEEEAAAAAEIMVDLHWDVPMPIGTIVPYATTDIPIQCIPCDGGTYLRVNYPILYGLLAPGYILNADEFTTPDLGNPSPLKYCMIAG